MFPYLFEVGGLPIPAYGVMLATGFLVGLLVATVRFQRDGLPHDWAWDLGILAMIGGVVGARLEYVRTQTDEFVGQWHKVFALRDGGMVFYGGLIGALALYLLYARWRKVSFFTLTDAMAPSVALGHAFGRVGCLGAGCCYGRPTDSWWAITFPEAAIAPAGVPRLPTQVHEIVFNLLLFAFLWKVPTRFPGQRFALLLVLYGAFRAFNEGLRADDRGFVFGTSITPGVATSALLALVAFGIWFFQRKVVITKNA